MNMLNLLQAVSALAMVLGLILGLAWALRRFAPGLLGRLQAPGGRKRLEIVETLVLDPTRRLVLVRLDNRERLILLGEGRELAEPLAASVAKPAPSVEAPAPQPRPRPVPVQASAPRAAAPRPAQPQPAQVRPTPMRAAQSAAPQMAKDPNDDLF